MFAYGCVHLGKRKLAVFFTLLCRMLGSSVVSRAGTGNNCRIGPFRVPKTLISKTRLSAKPCFLFSMASHLASL